MAAAGAFHDRLRPVVDRTMCRLVGPRDPDYDDLAQQALIELTTGVDRFRGECPIEAWAAVIVARVAYRQIRRRRVERRLFAVESAESREWPDRNASNSVVHRGTIRRVQRHLSAMDPNKAWTFLLHDVHGYSLEEVATITGVSNAAAQSRLVRGRSWLRARIARDPELADLLITAGGETS